MGDTTQGLTRRLVLDDLQLRAPPPVDAEQLIAALRHPSVEGFSRALELLQGGNHQRFAAVQEAAREQADAVGEADLRRLKRQFSSLKNTFLHYEVKNEFIAALLDGQPNGTEQHQLQQFEAEVERNVEALRELKGANEAAQEAIGALVGQACDTTEGFERQRAALAAELARLAQDLAQHEQDMHAPLPEGPGEGPGYEDCQAALAAAAAQERELEAALAMQLAEERELEAAVRAEHEERDTLRSHLAELELAAASAGERVELNARFIGTSQWADEAASALTLLGGVSLLHTGRDVWHLKLLTPYPEAAARGADPGPCAMADHELSLHLAPGSSAVMRAELAPADVEVTDIVEAAAAAAGQQAAHIVREVQARLSGWLHRQALVEEARRGGSGWDLTVDATLTSVRARHAAQGIEAEVRLAQSWPAGEDVAEVVEASGGGEGRAARVAGLRLPGKTLLQALEAVARELA